ncbi:MAG: hypothetical protein GXP62_15325 [Oligoflexia bacterium]|nr:hypothetical protein [Oligoflexia bacterium]
MLPLLLLFVACSDKPITVESNGGTQVGTNANVCQDQDCAFDEFCDDDACTPVIDRAFVLTILSASADQEYHLRVDIETDEGRYYSSVIQGTEAEWTESVEVVFSQPIIVELYDDPRPTQGVELLASWTIQGVDALVTGARDGQFVLTQDPFTVNLGVAKSW